jgi:hypothetical protein
MRGSVRARADTFLPRACAGEVDRADISSRETEGAAGTAGILAAFR